MRKYPNRHKDFGILNVQVPTSGPKSFRGKIRPRVSRHGLFMCSNIFTYNKYTMNKYTLKDGINYRVKNRNSFFGIRIAANTKR